jgi:hypothetical protein
MTLRSVDLPEMNQRQYGADQGAVAEGAAHLRITIQIA